MASLQNLCNPIRKKIQVTISNLQEIDKELHEIEMSRNGLRDTIIRIVLKYFDLKRSDLIIPRKKDEVVKIKNDNVPAFSILCYYLKVNCEYSDREIADVVYSHRQRVNTCINNIKTLDVRDKQQLKIKNDLVAIETILSEI